MKEFFHTVKFKIIIALTAVLIGAMIYSVTTGGYSSGSNYLFEVIFEPVRSLSSKISDKVSTSLDMVINAEKYYNENQQLKAQLNAIYNDVIDYDKVLEENRELRVMLELKEEYDNYKFSPPCTVIARTTNDPYGSFTVDKGAADGIEPGDPVVTETGIVGVCFEVSPSTSKVRTLYSPKTAVGVYTVRTKAEGIAEGGYDLAVKGKIRMSYISKDSDIKEGDVIVTSGSANYPAGQLIGTVESVQMEQNGLSKFAVLIPAEEPNTITSVFVITDYTLDEVTAIKTGQQPEETADEH
ncbi:MAG: rod shape-determining protein MreC [Oscillospiraceae bacterium]|nr:rod shape-determining protein MreC [Oscillospiraceae bacterium]MDY6207294.1 rod shape-determining protein MreC [Oscillospiraceae bacterium]